MDEPRHEVIEACKAGDEDAWKALIEHYQDPVFWVAFSRVKSFDIAADVTQEVFSEVSSRIHTFTSTRGEFSHWILTIAKFRAVSAYRKWRTGKITGLDEQILDVVDPVESPQERVQRDEEIRILLTALDEMDREEDCAKWLCSNILRMTYWDELSQAEIGDRLKVDAATVSRRLSSCKMRLFEIFRETADRRACPEATQVPSERQRQD